MPSRTQDKIYETFVAVSGGNTSSQHSMIDASERIAKPGARTGAQIRTAKPVTWRASELATPSRPAGTESITSSAGNTGASSTQTGTSKVLQSVFQGVPLVGEVVSAAAGTSASAGGGGIGNTIESLASTVLKSGLGMIPLIGGLLGLFGGGSSTTPTLTKYVMPASIAFEGADTVSGVGSADYDQMGMPRAFGGSASEATQTGLTGSAGSDGSSTAGLTSITRSSGSSGGSNTPALHDTADARAMDASWFMDRSAEIAAAVRYAMLNSNSINDVVNEL